MEALLRIEVREGRQAVSARELHSFLESKQEFAHWIKGRIDKYGLIEGLDFEVFDNFIKNPNGGRPLTEYALTVDAAKELSMVEGNEKGKQARRYFIEAEKAFRQLAQPAAIPQSFAEALRLAASQAEQIERQQKQIEAQQPRVQFAQAVETSKQSILIGELAKILRQNGISTGEKRLFEWMRMHGYLCSVGERYNQPMQRYVEQGLFEIKKQTVTKPDGTTLVSTTTKVTGKGQVYFVNKLKFPQEVLV